MRGGGMRRRWAGMFTVMAVLFSTAACATLSDAWSSASPSKPDGGNGVEPARPRPDDLSVEAAARIAAGRATDASAGARVLATALVMMRNRTVVVGGCWDYVNKAYTDAGFTADKRLAVYKQGEKGPFIEPTLIRPGDWLMFVNFTFSNVGHSAIFVEWIDFDKRSALTIEYVGQNRAMPGQYREYDITKCYAVFRGKE
jgi:hypothetical protein